MQQSLMLVKFKQRVPQFAGIDGHNYGAFSAGSVAEIPKIHAEALLKKGVCSLNVGYAEKNFNSIAKKVKKVEMNIVNLAKTRTDTIQLSFSQESSQDFSPKIPSNSVCILQYGKSTDFASLHNSLVQTDLHSSATSLLKTDLQSATHLTSSNFAYILPRQGISYGTCGSIKSIHKTEYDQCTDIYHHHCDRYECNSLYCADAILSKSSNRCAERLDQMSYLYHSQLNTKLGWVRHIVFSPPQEWALSLAASADGYKQLRSAAVDIAKSAGVLGGVITCHMYRIRGEPAGLNFDDSEDNPFSYTDEGIVSQLKKAGYGIGKQNGSKGNLWDGIFADALNLGSAYSYVYLSPHFHIHGYGHLENSRTFHNRTDWIYKNKGKRKNVKALRASIRYVISHASKLEVLGVASTQTTSWFGLLSYNKGGVDEIHSEPIPKTCEHGFQYYEVALNDSSLLFDEVWVREVKRFYRLSFRAKAPP